MICFAHFSDLYSTQPVSLLTNLKLTYSFIPSLTHSLIIVDSCWLSWWHSSSDWRRLGLWGRRRRWRSSRCVCVWVSEWVSESELLQFRFVFTLLNENLYVCMWAWVCVCVSVSVWVMAVCSYCVLCRTSLRKFAPPPHSPIWTKLWNIVSAIPIVQC
jgi:hypothetical protein